MFLQKVPFSFSSFIQQINPNYITFSFTIRQMVVDTLRYKGNIQLRGKNNDNSPDSGFMGRGGLGWLFSREM